MISSPRNTLPTISDSEVKAMSEYMINKSDMENNFFVYDEKGVPSQMVYIKKFRLSDVIEGASDRVHPAFIYGERELDGIYISKYQNILTNSLPYSVKGVEPATGYTFDKSAQTSREKGRGWHLMSMAEWGAIALLARKNGFLPMGNNDFGKDAREERISAEPAYSENGRVCLIKTGSGPVSYSHDNTECGVYDLSGNVWEWAGGMRIVYGEIQLLSNSVTCTDTDAEQSADSPYWMAIDGRNGSFISPTGDGKTPHSVKLDFKDGKWVYISGNPQSAESSCRHCLFSDVYADDSICEKARELLVALALLPDGKGEYGGVTFYANNGERERVCFRGGRFNHGTDSGLFKTCLDDPRSFDKPKIVGFRASYAEI